MFPCNRCQTVYCGVVAAWFQCIVYSVYQLFLFKQVCFFEQDHKGEWVGGGFAVREKKKEGCFQYRLRREGGIRVKQNFQYEIKKGFQCRSCRTFGIK